MKRSAACIICNSGNNKVYRELKSYSILRCSECGLFFMDPIPDKDNAKDHYKNMDPEYQWKYKEQVLKRGKKILSIIKRFGKSGYLLDAGCGYGVFLDLASRAGWKVSGVELSEPASSFAKEHYGLDVISADIRKAEFPDKTFDIITMQHILEHMDDPIYVLKLIRRFLKDDGFLVIVVPNVSSLMGMCGSINWLCLAEDTHLFHYNKHTLKKLLAKSGFSVVKVKTFQWDIGRVLWAFKILFFNPREKELINVATIEGNCKNTKYSFLKTVIIKVLEPLNYFISNFGLGEEILVAAKKDVTND
ncbi:MAG: class I SAM-dependent methyltransferase [Candidatus Omnitrophota bacterium]